MNKTIKIEGMMCGHCEATVKKALEAQKASFDWQKENGRYIPLPATWLNGKRWEDELEDVHSGLQSRNIENSTPGSDFEDAIF